MDVERVEKRRQGIYPCVVLTIDGRRAYLGLDQKLTLLDEYGAIYLGPEWEAAVSFALPADASKGQPAQTLAGFTDDPEVVRIYREWRAEIEAAAKR